MKKHRSIFQRNHTKKENAYIKKIKYQYLISKTKKEQDYYANILEGINFF